jgi:hypothetical protein
VVNFCKRASGHRRRRIRRVAENLLESVTACLLTAKVCAWQAWDKQRVRSLTLLPPTAAAARRRAGRSGLVDFFVFMGVIVPWWSRMMLSMRTPQGLMMKDAEETSKSAAGQERGRPDPTARLYGAPSPYFGADSRGLPKARKLSPQNGRSPDARGLLPVNQPTLRLCKP